MAEETSSPSEEFVSFNFLELPIGVYMVDEDGWFIECNGTVRKMFGLPLEGPVHANIGNFYANPDDRLPLLRAAIAADEAGKFLEKTSIHFRVNGADLYVEDYCKPIKHKLTGNVSGFVGCLVDVTADHMIEQRDKELAKRNEELTEDIGRILHANTTTLTMVNQTLNAVTKAFAGSPFPGDSVPTIEEIEPALSAQANVLANTIERFMQAGDEERRDKALPRDRWKSLAEQGAFLREYKERVEAVEFHPATLRLAAHTIGELCESVSPGHLPREMMKELQQATWHLERLTTLIDVLQTRAAVLQMEYTLQSLRDYATSDHRDTQQKVKCSVRGLVHGAVTRLATFAQSTRVEIRVQEMQEATVLASEREMERALSNLLHNAIKYTWVRDRTKASWVSIRTRLQDRRVYIEFENWGVPIAREEIEDGRVFTLGYRGILSKDRGRLGTGIGLTDAKRVAQSCGGDVTIESHPARPSRPDDPNYYDQPFVTKVTLYLPLSE